MTDVDSGAEALPQLEQNDVDANGHVSDVPDFANVEEFGDSGVPEIETTDAPGAEDVEDTPGSTKIYFVRVPRPPINDEPVKKLTVQFQEHVAKLKAVNLKLNTKREELRELWRQVNTARSLKDGSKEEYEDKLNRLKQLQQLRTSFTQQMQSIKETLRGLDCKSEEELDAKIKEMENRISHGSLALREEKQIVGQISKLQAQRGQIRDYDNQKGQLKELEAEASKVQTVIDELESPFTILKKEREAAQQIVTGILKKVDVAKKEEKVILEEQEEAVQAKNDALAALDKARADMNSTMSDYRENRSFSLRVRDMVTAGQVEEARALCAAQIDDMVSKLASDAAYRKEYCQLWAAQRRYAVSELLPDSTSTPKEPRADQGGKGPGGKGGKGAPAARAPPPKPQGAAKAKALIEQLMAEAQAEASRKTAGRPFADDVEDDGDADDELDEPAPAAPVPEAVKPKVAASARPADVLKSVELPKISNEVFVPPVIKTEADKAAESDKYDKQKLREEQARKAREAEERKRKEAERKEAKRKAAEVKRLAEQEQKAAEAVVAAERARQVAAEKAAAEAEAKAKADAARAAAAAERGAPGATQTNPAAKVIAKSQVTVAAKAKPPSNELVRYWKMFKKSQNLQYALAGFVLFAILLYVAILASR